MTDYRYTLRDDAPDWARDAWPGEEGEPMSAYDLPPSMTVGDDWWRNVCDRWEVVASLDHGRRAADEIMVTEVAILASTIMLPILSAMLGRNVTWDVDAWAAACEELAPYDGGWCEPTDDDPYGKRATWLHESVLHESVVWNQSYNRCGDVMVETSADAGMTWFLVRANEDGS